MLRVLTYFSILFFLSSCGDSSTDIALGTLERDRIVHKATANEVIVSAPATEGSQVKAGDLLVQLDTQRQEAKLALAQAEVSRAQASLEQLRNGARKEDVDAARARVHGAQANLDLAEKNYLRSKQLFEQKLSNQADLDRALGEREAAEASAEEATKALLSLTNGTRKEELEQGEAALAAANAQLSLEQYNLNELSIRATRDGYLDRLPWNEGERVQAGSTVAVMLANTQAFARVYVPEIWRVKVVVGQDYEVKIDGLDKTMTAKLRWIASEASFTPYYALNERDRSRLVYVAEFDIEESDALPIGLPVEVILSE